MQNDLQNFLVRIVRTITMSLVPVVFIAFITLPASLHHHIGTPDMAVETTPEHMS
jgi:hypothetical protein